jgi:hypothetical protein
MAVAKEDECIGNTVENDATWMVQPVHLCECPPILHHPRPIVSTIQANQHHHNNVRIIIIIIE